jgi:hypothetical protein
MLAHRKTLLTKRRFCGNSGLSNYIKIEKRVRDMTMQKDRALNGMTAAALFFFWS